MKLKYLILLSVMGTVISLDQLTKHLVTGAFSLGESIRVLPEVFSITYVQNPGAAFGLLSRAHDGFRIPFFIVVPTVALVIIAGVFRKVDDRDYLLSSALSLVIGGAIGNLIDRITYGHVIDFLDFYWGAMGPHFPAFNVADSAITIGVAVLMLDMFFKERRERRLRSQKT